MRSKIEPDGHLNRCHVLTNIQLVIVSEHIKSRYLKLYLFGDIAPKNIFFVSLPIILYGDSLFAHLLLSSPRKIKIPDKFRYHYLNKCRCLVWSLALTAQKTQWKTDYVFASNVAAVELCAVVTSKKTAR